MQNPPPFLDEVLLRFPHLGEKIFNSLGNKSFARCREVNRVWNNFFEDQRLQWVGIIQKRNVELCKNDKRRIFESFMRKNSFIHIAAKVKEYLEYNIFNIISEYQNYEYPQNKYGETPFQVSCKYRHLLHLY